MKRLIKKYKEPDGKIIPLYEFKPTGITDALIFKGGNPFNVWRGSQYLYPYYNEGKDYMTYVDNENHAWQVPFSKIFPDNNDELTPQQRLERDYKKSPAYGFDKVMLGTLGLGAAPFFAMKTAPTLVGLANAASDAAMATRAGQAVYQELTSPMGKAALSSVFGGMGMHNFFSDNGYAKTLQEWENLKNDPNFYNAVSFGKSALGDAMDVTMMAPLYKPLTYVGKEVWNLGKQGDKWTANMADRVARNIYAPYDYLRTIDETAPKVIPSGQIQKEMFVGRPFKNIQEPPTVNWEEAQRTANHYKNTSFAERLGIPKGERNSMSLEEQQGLQDLEQYINSGQYRLSFRVWPLENGDVDWGWRNPSSEGVPFLKWAADNGLTARGSSFRIGATTDTGKGVLSYNFDKGMAGYSSRMFPTPHGLKYAPGEANMFLDGNNHKIILTSPKVDIQDFLTDLKNDGDPLYEQLIEQLSTKIDKDIMKDFWINARKVQKPGTYLSGDNGRAPIGSSLIDSYKKKQLYKADFRERPLDQQFVRRTGVSPDSYSSIIRQGNRDGSLRWGEGFIKWNNSAVDNKHISDAFADYMAGKISKEEYENIFNTWSASIGGKPLRWLYNIGNKPYPVHPHPYIYSEAYGGRLLLKEKNNGEVY